MIATENLAQHGVFRYPVAERPPAHSLPMSLGDYMGNASFSGLAWDLATSRQSIYAWPRSVVSATSALLEH